MTANYKKQKAGKAFPGNLPRHCLIAMQERKDTKVVYAKGIVQEISIQASSKWRKEVAKRKNKRFRQKSKQEIQGHVA